MSWATDFMSAHADDYSGSKIKAPTFGSSLQKGYSKVFKSYADEVPTLSGSYKKPKMSAAGYYSAQSLSPYLGGTATAVSAISSRERSIPERVDPMKELGRLTSDPLKASNDLAASGLTTALGVLGTGPSFTLERPLATAGAISSMLGVDPSKPHRMLDTELRQSLGPVYGTASDIVGAMGNVVAGFVGFGGDVLMNVQTAIPALYNSSDVQNAAKLMNADRNSIIGDRYQPVHGDLPTNILGFLASIIPTSTSNPYNAQTMRRGMTVGEFLSDMEARGFTREEIEKVANGKMSPFDFGSKAMSQNEAAEIIARVTMDPTIILLAPGVPSMIAGSAVKVGMRGSQILRLGEQAVQAVNFGKRSTTLTSVLGATQAAAKMYRKAAIGTTAVEVGLRGTELGLDAFAPAWRDSKVDPVYNSFLKPLFELNNAAISNRPLSDKPLIAMWAAFKTPIHQSFGAVGEASHRVFVKAFGGEFTEPVFREITSNLSKAEILKRYEEMGLSGAKTFAAKRAAVATEMMGGEMGVANVLSHFLATVVWDKMPINVKENLAQGIGGIDEAAIKAAVIHMMVTDILKSQATSGRVRVSPGEVVAAMKKHFKEGNVEESLVNNRWDGDLFVQQWDQFEKVVTPITEAMHASLAESFGTSRNNLPNVTLREVLPKEFIDVLSGRLKATAKGDRISLDVIREELATRFPVLERMDPDFWGAMKLDSAKAPTLKEVQAKLKLYRKSAPSLHDFYKNDAAAEAAARSSAGAELTAPLHDVPMDGLPTSTARFTASNFNADMGVARSVTEAGEMHAHPAVDLFEIGAPRAMAEAGFPIQRATRTESVVNGRAVPSVSITVAGDSIFDFRRPAAAAGRTSKADYVEITIRGDDLGRVLDEKGKPVQPNGFVVSWDIAGKTAAELDVISESLRQAGVTEFEVIRSDSLIEVKMTAAEAKSLMDKVDAADEALTSQGVPVYEVQKAYVERVHRTKALADSGPTYRTVLDAAKSDRRVAGWALASRRNLTPGPAGGVASFHDGPNGSVLREANHDPRVRIDRLQSPAATEGIGYGDTFKFHGPPTPDGDYAYHVTAPDNVYGIYGRGQIDPVRADTPVRGAVAGRAKWVDGTNKGRTYWNRDPRVAAAGASGQGAVIAVRTDSPKIDGLFAQEAGSDHLISERPIKSEELWVLGGDGQWYPMDGFHGGKMDFDPNNVAAQVQREAHAAAPKPTGLAPVQELQTRYITNVATRHGVDAATGTHGIRLSPAHDPVGIVGRIRGAYDSLTTTGSDAKKAATLRARLKGYMDENGAIKPGMEGRAQRTQKQLENLLVKKPGLRSSKAQAQLEIELGDQLDHAIDAGYTFERYDGQGEPYANADEMIADIRDNKHLFYSSDDTGNTLRGEMTTSEALSVLHDLYGYAATGFERTPEGSVNALLAHARMFSPEARKALVAEWARRQAVSDFNHGVGSAGMSSRVRAIQARVVYKQKIQEHIRRNFPTIDEATSVDLGDLLSIIAERWAVRNGRTAGEWLGAWFKDVDKASRKMSEKDLLDSTTGKLMGEVFAQRPTLVREDILARAGEGEYANLHAELVSYTRWVQKERRNVFEPGTERRVTEIVARMRKLQEDNYMKGPPKWVTDAAEAVDPSWSDWHKPEAVDAGEAGTIYLPGGVASLDDPNFRFTLWDVHVLRAQAIDAAHLMDNNPLLSAKIYRKMFQSLERDLSDPMESFGLTAFALLSPSLDFHINEAKYFMIRPKNREDMVRLASYVEHLPIGEDGMRVYPGLSKVGELGLKMYNDYKFPEAHDVTGKNFGMFTPFFQIASAADLYLRSEAEGSNFFSKPKEMTNEVFAERIMNKIPGAGPKVATFAPMLGGPVSGLRGTIDVHMMNYLNKFIDDNIEALRALPVPDGASPDFWTKKFNNKSALGKNDTELYDSAGNPFEHLRDLEDLAHGKKVKKVFTISGGEYDRANQILQKAKDADEVMLRQYDPTFSWEDYFGLGGYQWWRWDTQRHNIIEPHVNVYPGSYKLGQMMDPRTVGEHINWSQRWGRSSTNLGAGLPLTPYDPWSVSFAQMTENVFTAIKRATAEDDLAIHVGDLTMASESTLGSVKAGSDFHYGTGVYFDDIGAPAEGYSTIDVSGLRLFRPPDEAMARDLYEAMRLIDEAYEVYRQPFSNEEFLAYQRVGPGKEYTFDDGTTVTSPSQEIWDAHWAKMKTRGHSDFRPGGSFWAAREKAAVAAVRKVFPELSAAEAKRAVVNSIDSTHYNPGFMSMTPGTRFLMKLGFEGVDVRHLPDMGPGRKSVVFTEALSRDRLRGAGVEGEVGARGFTRYVPDGQGGYKQMSWGTSKGDATTVIHELVGHMGRDGLRQLVDDSDVKVIDQFLYGETQGTAHYQYSEERNEFSAVGSKYGGSVNMQYDRVRNATPEEIAAMPVGPTVTEVTADGKRITRPGTKPKTVTETVFGKWPAEFNETFARLVEDYILRGDAPTPQVAAVLQKVKDYFVQVYKQLVGSISGRKMAPDVKEVFDKIFSGDESTSTYWDDLAGLEQAMRDEAPTPPEPKVGMLPDDVNKMVDDLVDDPANADYGTSSPDIMTSRTEGDMRSTFAAADPDLVTWSAERDFYTHHLVPGINSGFFNGKGDLYRAVVSQWDRRLLNEAPMYTVLKPSPNIFRRYDSQLAGKLSEDQAAAAYYLAGRTSLGRLLLDYGPMGKVTAAARWLLRPVPGSALSRDAQQALIDEFNELGIKPSDTVKALTALRTEATRHKVHDIPIYRGPENMFSGTIANTIRDVIGDRIPEGVSNRQLVAAFDRSSSRFMRYADARMAKAGTMEKGFLGAADYAYRMFQGEKGYGKALWGKMGGGTRVVSKTFYHWYRFLMDPRWWAMNLMERDAFSYLRNGEKAVRPTHLDIERSTAFQMHAGMTDVTHMDTRMMDPGFESMRNYTAAIAKNFDVERPDLTAALVKRVITEDPVNAGGLYRMFGEGKTVDQYVAELDSWLYTFNEKGAGVIHDEAARMAEQMRIPPGTAEHKMFMEFADKIYQEHHALYENLTNTFQGRGDRTSLERMLNSYWLYWPLSYQLKAGKWMVDLLTKRAVGYNTNLGGAAYLNLIIQHHQDLMESDVTYRKAFEEHPAMWGFAGMMLPATPWDWGVSLSRPTRYAAGWVSSETDTGVVGEYRATKDPLTMMMSIAQMGPTYTFGVPLGGGAWRGPVPDMAKEFGIPGPWTNASY